MSEKVVLKLRKVFKLAWWCPRCWQRGELLVARGTEPYHIQVAADNLHLWNPTNCPVQRVRVEFNSRREVRVTEASLRTRDNFLGDWEVRIARTV